MSDDNPESEEPGPSTGADPRPAGWRPTVPPEKSSGSEPSESSSSTPSSPHSISQASLEVASQKIAAHPKSALRVALTILLGIIILGAADLLYTSVVPVIKFPFVAISVFMGGLAVFGLVWLWRERSAQTSGDLSGYSPPQPPPVWPDTSLGSKVKPRIPSLPLMGEIHHLHAYAQGKERGWRFRLQCYDNAGNPFAPLPVEIPIAKDKSDIFENDRVEVSGKWRKRTGVRARRIRNLETGIDIQGAHLLELARTGYLLMGLGIALIVLYFLSTTNWFNFLSKSLISLPSTMLLAISLFVLGALLVMMVKVKE